MENSKHRTSKKNYVQQIIYKIFTPENMQIIFETKDKDLELQKSLMIKDFLRRNKIRECPDPQNKKEKI